MVHLVVKILMGLVLLGLVDLHHIQQEMALQFRWLQSEVLPQLLLILFLRLKLLKLRPIMLLNNKLWN